MSLVLLVVLLKGQYKRHDTCYYKSNHRSPMTEGKTSPPANEDCNYPPKLSLRLEQLKGQDL
jgi:hypothetical protein